MKSVNLPFIMHNALVLIFKFCECLAQGTRHFQKSSWTFAVNKYIAGTVLTIAMLTFGVFVHYWYIIFSFRMTRFLIFDHNQ